MTKSETLAFLELPEDATKEEIKKSIEFNLAHFEQLSEKAPSEFLRKLNAQKVLKLKSIQIDYLKWDTDKRATQSGIHFEPASEDLTDKEENILETTPIIISHGSRSSKSNPVTEPAGWLVRHTENQSPKTYSLWKGNNYIGRKLHDTLKAFIVIDEDLFISRVHALITVEGTDTYSFYIEDSAFSNKGSESKNGTFINGRETRITEKQKLKENDTLQIGVTKLMLRYNTHPIKKIIKEVEKSKFMDTVALEL